MRVMADRSERHSFSNRVGNGSRSHAFVADLLMNFAISSSVTERNAAGGATFVHLGSLRISFKDLEILSHFTRILSLTKSAKRSTISDISGGGRD